MPRICHRVALTTAATVALVMIAGSAAWADNKVLDTDPRPGSATVVEPGRVTIAFRDDVPSESITILVEDSTGKDVSNGTYQHDANNIYVDLQYPLPRGTYTVSYRALDSGRVPFGGSFQFTYGSKTKQEPGAPADGKTSTFRGRRNIPKDLALPGDSSLPPSDQAPGSSATPEPTISPSAGPDAAGKGRAVVAHAAREDDDADSSIGRADTPLPWIAGGLVALLMLAVPVGVALRGRATLA